MNKITVKSLLFACGLVFFLPSKSIAQGILYGTTSEGGSSNNGTIFKFDLGNSTLTKQIDFFSLVTGSYCTASLIQVSNDVFYGVNRIGGLNNEGVIFEYKASTNSFTPKYTFGGVNGSVPTGTLIMANDGMLYGVTSHGGAFDFGVLFQFDPNTGVYEKKIDFQGASNGSLPQGGLTEASDGKLYGMTWLGGSNDFGILFQYDPISNTLTKKLDFNGISNGKEPTGSLIEVGNGKLYGLTSYGGTNIGILSEGSGVLFEYDINSNTFTKKHDFSGELFGNGSNPASSLILGSDGKLYGMTPYGGTDASGVIFEFNLTTNTYSSRYNFSATSTGKYPKGSLFQASDGKMYGMTSAGGANDLGTLIQFDPATSICVKKVDFNGSGNGGNPQSTLVEIDQTLFLSPLKKNKKVTIFPIPVIEKEINIQLAEELSGKMTIQIIDFTGKVVHEDIKNSTSSEIINIQLNELCNGIYFVKISDEQKKELANEKIVLNF
jgi:uncharacterized repeat protein (TIGR03803 family)